MDDKGRMADVRDRFCVTLRTASNRCDAPNGPIDRSMRDLYSTGVGSSDFDAECDGEPLQNENHDIINDDG